MKMIRQSHEIWGETPSDLTEQFRWIERAGRVCWQSEDKITPDSWKPFIEMIISKGHTSVLEHSNVVSESNQFLQDIAESGYIRHVRNYSSANIRIVWEELGDTIDDMLAYWQTIIPVQPCMVPQLLKRITVEFITNRAVSHELVRHRVASYSQSSQRYIRYDRGISFIEPHYWSVIADSARVQFVDGLLDAEACYVALREEGLSPQDARHALPNATATKLIMTAYLPDWWKVFDLRCSSAADPQMRDLMIPLREEFKQRGWTV